MHSTRAAFAVLLLAIASRPSQGQRQCWYVDLISTPLLEKNGAIHFTGILPTDCETLVIDMPLSVKDVETIGYALKDHPGLLKLELVTNSMTEAAISHPGESATVFGLAGMYVFY